MLAPTKKQQERSRKIMKKKAESLGLAYIGSDIYGIPNGDGFTIDLSSIDPEKILLAVYLKTKKDTEESTRKQVQKDFQVLMGVLNE